MSYGYSEVERADEALVCMRKVVRCCVWRRWGLRGKVDGWMVSRTRPVILRDATGYGKNNRGLRLKVALSSKMQLVVAWLFFSLPGSSPTRRFDVDVEVHLSMAQAS